VSEQYLPDLDITAEEMETFLTNHVKKIRVENTRVHESPHSQFNKQLRMTQQTRAYETLSTPVNPIRDIDWTGHTGAWINNHRGTNIYDRNGQYLGTTPPNRATQAWRAILDTWNRRGDEIEDQLSKAQAKFQEVADEITEIRKIPPPPTHAEKVAKSEQQAELEERIEELTMAIRQIKREEIFRHTTDWRTNEQIGQLTQTNKDMATRMHHTIEDKLEATLQINLESNSHPLTS
jgi:hypothetical protein